MTGAVKVLQGHEDMIQAIAFSQDGKQLASASFDQTVRLWDLTSTNLEVKSFEGLRWLLGPYIIIAQDGMHLAQVPRMGGRLTVGYLSSDYNLETNLANVDIRDATSVAFSQDGRQLALACRESITLWNLTSQPFTKRTIPRDHGYLDQSTALAFSQDGRQLACFDHMGKLTLWDLTSCPSKQECIELDKSYNAAGTITFSPDDKQLAIALCDEAEPFFRTDPLRDDAIEIWDLTSTPLKRRKVLRTPVSPIFAMAFSKDGKQLVSAGEDRMIRRHDLTSDFDWKAASPEGHVEGFGFSQNGRQLVSFMRDGTLRLLGSETGKYVETLESGPNLLFPSYVTSQMKIKELDGCYMSDRLARVWDFTSGPIRKRELALPLLEKPERLMYRFLAAISHDGQLARLLIRADNPDVCMVEVWDLTHNLVKTKQFELCDSRILRNLLFSPDGKKLAICTGFSIIICDLASNPVQQRFMFKEAGLAPQEASRVTFSHDSNQLASITSDGMITLWDLTSNPVQTKEVGRHKSNYYGILMALRGEQLVLLIEYEQLILWDLTSGIPAEPIEIPLGASVDKLSFSCNGKYLDTNRGQFPLPSNATHDSSNVSPLIFVKKSWVSKDGEDILWLPVEHRSYYVAVHESMIGYISQSGQMTVIKFDFSKQID